MGTESWGARLATGKLERRGSSPSAQQGERAGEHGPFSLRKHAEVRTTEYTEYTEGDGDGGRMRLTTKDTKITERSSGHNSPPSSSFLCVLCVLCASVV